MYKLISPDIPLPEGQCASLYPGSRAQICMIVLLAIVQVLSCTSAWIWTTH